MREEDFDLHNITCFTPEEVRGTGADLFDISLLLMLMLQKFRKSIGRKVVLLPKGMTTGEHKSQEHRMGLAVDVAFTEQDGPVDIAVVFRSCLTAGAKGIGVYWNGSAYSVHMDLRKEYTFWGAWKAHRKNTWNYTSLLKDPAEWERGAEHESAI